MTNTKTSRGLGTGWNIRKLKLPLIMAQMLFSLVDKPMVLRSRAGTFTMDELREGIEYAHARGVDVHVASNMVNP